MQREEELVIEEEYDPPNLFYGTLHDLIKLQIVNSEDKSSIVVDYDPVLLEGDEVTVKANFPKE